MTLISLSIALVGWLAYEPLVPRPQTHRYHAEVAGGEVTES